MAYVYIKGKEIEIVNGQLITPECFKGRKFSKGFISHSQKKKKIHYLGRRGLCANRSRIFGKCADCKETRKLTGFLCQTCYNSRFRKHQYQTDKKYREEQKKRNKQHRKRCKRGKLQSSNPS